MKRPKVGLALSEGSARGLTHIGVLRVLEKHKIPIDYIAGTSIGAAIGALYASGYNSHDLENLVKTTRWVDLMQVSNFKRGIIQQKRIYNYLKKLFDGKRFEDLKIPIAVTAVDVYKGVEVVFDKGNLAKAVNASMAIPGLFDPVFVGGRKYVDGGVVDPVPVGVLNRKKMDVTIAVDLSIPVERYKFSRSPNDRKNPVVEKVLERSLKNVRDYLVGKKGFPRVAAMAFSPSKVIAALRGPAPEIVEISAKSFNILMGELVKARLKEHKPSVVIKPNIVGIGMFDFYKYKACIKRGENATRRQVGLIKKLAKV